MQLERLLQSQGFGSRKECRELVRRGRVAIDGNACTDPFAEIELLRSPAGDGIEFVVDGQAWQYRENAYVLLHKPAGYECSHKPSHHPSVYSLLPQPLVRRGVQAAGRLDHDSSGLLLFSDDGQFIHRWTSGRRKIPKTYHVELSEPAGAEIGERLCAGVQLHGETRPIAALACRQVDERCLELTIGEGKYHQVKRMVAAAGNHVARLHRVRIGGLVLDAELAPGQWRWLEADDLDALARF